MRDWPTGSFIRTIISRLSHIMPRQEFTMHRFALVFALVSLGAAGPAPLKPLDVFNLQLASDPQISPDGKRIVYVRQSSDVMNDRRRSNLWIINFAGAAN